MLSSRGQYHFVLAIPVINVVADSLQDYFQPGLASPGYIRAMIILAFLVFYFKEYYRRNRLNNLIVISLLYFFILGFFSSNLFYSQSVFGKYLIGSMMFPVGYYYFRASDQFCRLIQIMMLVLGIFVLVLIISNIFSLGSSDYLEGSVYFGSGRVNLTKTMMILVLISPLSFRYERNKIIRRLNILIVLSAVILILIGVKRSALLGLFIGYLIYFVLAPQKTSVTKGLFLVSLILLLTSPLYYDTLIQRIEARQAAGRFDFSEAEEEGRVVELKNVLDAFNNGKVSYKLFGAEFFNSMKYFNTNRMLHTDYATILAGAGIVGIILFFMVYYLVLKRSYYLYKAFKTDSNIRDIMAISMTLIFSIMIAGIGGTVTEIGIRAVVFLFWGAALGFIEYKPFNKDKNNSQILVR